jgi:polar amino acid transport system substrate-binding protein
VVGRRGSKPVIDMSIAAGTTPFVAELLVGVLALGAGAPGLAQPNDIGRVLAPTGKLRVGVLMVSYFAIDDKSTGGLKGVIPDLGEELARRAGVSAELLKFSNPALLIDAFRRGDLDVTFVGITSDRAEAMDFGPVIMDLQTTYLVPAASPLRSIAAVDRKGVRILVPQRSAQEAYLKKTITAATLVNVAVETPKQAVELLAAGQAEAFSHVAPMLASAQPMLPGSRILPGSYFNVPIAIAVAKGRSPVVAEFCRRFAEAVKASGFLAGAIERAGVTGVVVHAQ